jgi:hypothetical protein
MSTPSKESNPCLELLRAFLYLRKDRPDAGGQAYSTFLTVSNVKTSFAIFVTEVLLGEGEYAKNISPVSRLFVTHSVCEGDYRAAGSDFKSAS